METLTSVGSLVNQQWKEWGEILTGFETRNCFASVGIGQILKMCYSFVDIFERDLV